MRYEVIYFSRTGLKDIKISNRNMHKIVTFILRNLFKCESFDYNVIVQ